MNGLLESGHLTQAKGAHLREPENRSSKEYINLDLPDMEQLEDAGLTISW